MKINGKFVTTKMKDVKVGDVVLVQMRRGMTPIVRTVEESRETYWSMEDEWYHELIFDKGNRFNSISEHEMGHGACVMVLENDD